MAFYDKIRIGIKLLFSKERELYSFFYGILGYCPRKLSLYKQACRHRSQTQRSKNGEFINNERLEFLGDAVLNTIVADMLYRRYRRGREGFLTNTRSKIVQRETLNVLADKIGLTKMLMYSHPVHSHNCCMGGNALEALIGAIYLDRGYEACRKYVVKRLIKPHIDVKELVKKEVNYKSKLIEWSQKFRVEIVFDLVETTYDEDKNPRFYSVVRLAGIESGSGTGYTKKESHQEAAKMAYLRLNNSDEFRDSVLEKATELQKENNSEKEEEIS